MGEMIGEKKRGKIEKEWKNESDTLRRRSLFEISRGKYCRSTDRGPARSWKIRLTDEGS